MQAFSDYYKTISNAELIAILSNLENYQPEAVIAAQKEFKSRALSEQDIMEANEIIESAKAKKNKLKMKATAIGSSVLQTGFSVAETVSPIQKEPLTPEKIIRILSIVFGGIFVLSVYSYLRNYIYLAKHAGNIKPVNIEIFLMHVVLLASIITFVKKINIGWYLIAFYIVSALCGGLYVFVDTWKIKQIHTFLWGMDVLFYCAMLYVICKKNLRGIYNIDKSKLVACIFMSILITLCSITLIS